MTDVDENLLTGAKLREQIDGDLDSDLDHYQFTGLVDHVDASNLAFLEATLGETWTESPLNDEVMMALRSERETEAVTDGNASILSHVVGITEQDLDASSLTLPFRFNDHMDNNGAPAFMTAAGNPNTGKTNTAIKLIEMRTLYLDELLVISNVRSWDACDIHVTSAHDLMVQLLEHRETPKAVLIDEGSTHFDARTYRQEIATQYTPLAKRYAKVGVDLECVIVHTGKDLHPERKRLSDLAFYKEDKKAAEFFAEWPEDSDRPANRLFGGSVESIEKADGYHPDDSAPWSWDLEPELFTRDMDWHELRSALG